MSCSDCSIIEPIEDAGSVKLKSASSAFISALQNQGLTIEGNPVENYTILYQTREELLGLLSNMSMLEKQFKRELSICIKGSGGDRRAERWLSISQLENRILNYKLVDIISNTEFSSYMQPIVDFSEAIIGFEFLLRPIPGGSSFKPYELFEMARQSGLHSFLDRAARISAIETGAKLLPKGYKRFINFLPSSIYNPKYCLTHTFAAIERLNQDPNDFVFEVVETEGIRDISRLKDIFEEYRNQGMHVALDDVGTGYSTVDVMSRLKPDYIKIDRSLISYCDEDVLKQGAIKEIIARAADFGGKVLAEGMERREEFLYCRELGIPLAQGFLFGKAEEKPPANFTL